MVRLLDDPDTARRMGAAAAEEVAARYSLEAMVRRIEALYDEVLDG